MRLLFFIAALLVFLRVQAQTVTNNTSLTIQPGLELTIKGDLQNNTGSSISNNGVLELSGNWVNNSQSGIFGSSQGTVLLSGDAQQIGGDSSTAFYNLSLAGTNVKTLQQPASVGNALSLSDRFLDLNTHQLTITNSNITAITRTTGFIQSETDPMAGYSALRWNIGNAGTGSIYVFPFGNIAGNAYLPFSATIGTAGTETTNGYLSAATYPTDVNQLPNNRPLPTGVPTYTDSMGNENAAFGLDRFWVLNTGNYSIQPTASLQFTYRNEEWQTGNNTIMEDHLQMQFHDGSIWNFTPLGFPDTVSNFVLTPVITLGNAVWSAVDFLSPLPIHLLSFDAKPVSDDAILCNWITETETDNAWFTVERSRDAITFETAGTVPGAGNSLIELHYSFTDHQPYRGYSFYRLRQTDFNGSYSYSKTVRVFLKNRSSEISLFPNPATDKVSLHIPEGMDVTGMVITLTDVAGHELYRGRISELGNQGIGIYELNRGALAAGTYLCTISNQQAQLYQAKITFL